MIKKFLSRKFILSLLSVICGILGMVNISEDLILQIGNILLVAVPSVVYVITEGKIDRNSLESDMKKILEIIELGK